jgi:hypothetical protein
VALDERVGIRQEQAADDGAMTGGRDQHPTGTPITHLRLNRSSTVGTFARRLGVDYSTIGSTPQITSLVSNIRYTPVVLHRASP